MRQEKQMNGEIIEKGEIKLPLCKDNMIIYTENPKKLPKSTRTKK